MVKTKKKKICIVATSLSKGGAERSAANLSKMLFELGHDIHVVTVLTGIDYDFKGTLFDLGKFKKDRDTVFGRLRRLQIFKKYLYDHKFDVIIDHRSRVQAYREFIVTCFIYKFPTIYVIHNFNQKKVFTKYNMLNRWLYKNEHMVAVSQAAEKKFETLFGLNHISTIYNGFDFENIQQLAAESNPEPVDETYILFYGRIEDHHKNLKLLLDAFKKSTLPSQAVKLLVLGDGRDLSMIKAYATQLELNASVVFKGFAQNPYPYVKKAKFTVLTSRYEGFPMVIPESLSLKVPVVAVDCNSGPNEVIVHGQNGMLVENHKPEKLAVAFEQMFSDTNLYETCVNNTIASIQKFSHTEVMKTWERLIQSISK